MAALASFDVFSPATIAGEPIGDAGACAFCGFHDRGAARTVSHRRPNGSTDQLTACLICASIQDPGRPAIDHEAVIVWMPETSQAALNRMVRGIHTVLVTAKMSPALHEHREADALPAIALYRSLAERRRDAAARIGTTSPGLLGRAVLRFDGGDGLSRAAGTTGLRLLHLGRHFVDGRDIYPDIVRGWIASRADGS